MTDPSTLLQTGRVACQAPWNTAHGEMAAPPPVCFSLANYGQWRLERGEGGEGRGQGG